MLINIQLLRFVAATLVVFYHTAGYMPSLDHPVFAPFTLGSVIGFAGVDVFFVISGFIMAYTTRDSTGHADGLDFARRRVARIYSGYWPFFFLALAVFHWARSEHLEQARWLKSFFLWPQPLNFNVLEISWTLSFEMYFYLLFTILVWALPSSRRVVACTWMLSSVVLFNLWRHFVLDGFSTDNFYYIGLWDTFLSSPFIVEFFAGALAAYWLAKYPSGMAWTWLIAGTGLFLTGGLVSEYFYQGRIEQGFYIVPRVALFGSASLMMLVGLVRLENRGRLAPYRFSLVFGGATYAIYLAHIPVLGLLHWLGLTDWARQRDEGVVFVAYLAVVLGILIASAIYYRLAERRLYRLFKRLLGVTGR